MASTYDEVLARASDGMSTDAEVHAAIARHPAPWRVGERNSTRSMWPVRDANGKVAAYAYNREVARLLAALWGAFAQQET